MFNIDDLIVYDNTGVCKVTGITKIKNVKSIDKKQEYYVLEPLFQSGTIYTPTNTKVFMRNVLDKQQALELIDNIPSVRAKALEGKSMQEMVERYNSAFLSHDCEDLIRLLSSIYDKKVEREQQKKKFGYVDEKYMKKAESLLFGELAVVFGIEPEQVPDFISERLGGK